MPRPSVLSREVAERITRLIMAGVPSEVAAEATGIGSTTFFRWLQRAREDEDAPEPRIATGAEMSYREFGEAVTRARALAEVRAVATVMTTMERDWRAAAWFLERRDPKRWGPRSRVTNVHLGDPEHPVVIANVTESRELLQQRLADVQRKRSS